MKYKTIASARNMNIKPTVNTIFLFLISVFKKRGTGGKYWKTMCDERTEGDSESKINRRVVHSSSPACRWERFHLLPLLQKQVTAIFWITILLPQCLDYFGKSFINRSGVKLFAARHHVFKKRKT